VIISFNTSTISCAIIRLNGGYPKVSDGVRTVVSHLPSIIGWTLIAGTVGPLLRLLQLLARREDSFIGNIAIAILGAVWSINSYLVIPVMVLEEVGPLNAVRRSATLMRKAVK